MPDDFFAAEALKRCTTQSRRKKLLRFDDFFRKSQELVEIKLLSQVHGAAKMRLWRHASLLEKGEINLRYRDPAYGEAGGFFTS